MEEYLNYETHQKIWDETKRLFLSGKFNRSDITELKRAASENLGLPKMTGDCVGCEFVKRADPNYCETEQELNCSLCPLGFDTKCLDHRLDKEESLWELLENEVFEWCYSGDCDKELILELMDKIRNCGWKGKKNEG